MTLSRDDVIYFAEEANFDLLPPDEYHLEHEIVDSGNKWITERMIRFANLIEQHLKKDMV